MGLETQFDNLEDLNPDWPLGTDPKSEGDNHLRGVKLALRGNIRGDGAVTQLLVAGEPKVLATPEGVVVQMPDDDLTTGWLKFAREGDDSVVGGILLRPQVDMRFRVGDGGASTFVFQRGNGEKTAASFNLDGESALFYDGAGDTGLRTQSTGGLVHRSGSGHPVFSFQNADGVKGHIRVRGDALGLDIAVEGNEPVNIRSGGLSGTDLAVLHPVNGFTLNHAGVARLTSQSYGLLHSGTVLDQDAGAGNSSQIRFRNADFGGSLYMTAGGSLSLRHTSGAGSLGDIAFQAAIAGWAGMGFQGTDHIRTQSADEWNSGGSVTDLSGARRPIGYNVMPRIDLNGSRPVNVGDVGKRIRHSRAAVDTLTCADIGNDGATIIYNGTDGSAVTGVLHIAQGGGDLRWFNGAGVESGDRQMAHGGMATLVQLSAAVWEIWGSGIS